jgi:4-hydroxybutyrate dehydrogenase/sulfolactaldehyde 3-reductase
VTTIAFIGLGVMGAPMARRLISSGFHASVYDVRTEARAAFSGLDNCRVATSPGDAAAGADYLFTMLPESPQVHEVLFSEQGAVHGLADNALVVEMSTGDARQTMTMGGSLAQIGKRMIDCPVGRTPADAQAGTLLVLVGGPDDIVEEARPMLACFGNEIVHVGPFGSAIKLKLVNNYMSMVGIVMTAETLMFGRKLGLDRDTLVHVLQNTVAGRGQINVNFPKKVLAGDLSADFPLRLGLKDLSLALDLAKSAGAPLMLGGVARELFALAAPWGRSEQDCTAMLLLLEDIARCDETGEVQG